MFCRAFNLEAKPSAFRFNETRPASLLNGFKPFHKNREKRTVAYKKNKLSFIGILYIQRILTWNVLSLFKV